MPEPRGSYGHFCAAEFGLKENIFNGFSENPPKRRARSRLLHRRDSEPRDGAEEPATEPCVGQGSSAAGAEGS